MDTTLTKEQEENANFLYQVMMSCIDDKEKKKLGLYQKILFKKVMTLTNSEKENICCLLKTMTTPELLEIHIANIIEVIKGLYYDNKDNWGRIIAVLTFVTMYMKVNLPMRPVSCIVMARAISDFVIENRDDWIKEQGGLKNGIRKRFPFSYVWFMLKSVLV